MRAFDKKLELIVCGSSHANMPTYPDWEREVLEHTYDNVDHISLHMYFANRENERALAEGGTAEVLAKNTANYLALNEKLDRYIATVASTISFVKSKKRSKHDVYISFDEWNVWYHSNKQDRKILDGNDGWPHAPRLLEDIYNFEDVLQVGLILNTFIRRSDVVKLACIAQLVNVIAPIMTDPKGQAWRQTIYYPYYFASVYGRGTALQLAINTPGYDAEHGDNIGYVDVSGVHNQEDGTISFFAVNRHATEAIDVDLSLEGFGAATVIDHQVMTHANLRAVNTATEQTNVAPSKGSGAKVDGKVLSVKLQPHSYQMIRVKV
jgi:alpha-L-arabinofuranosidase